MAEEMNGGNQDGAGEVNADVQTDDATVVEPDKQNPEKRLEKLGYEVTNMAKRFDKIEQLLSERSKPEPKPEPSALDKLLSGNYDSDESDIVRALAEKVSGLEGQLSSINSSATQANAIASRLAFREQYPDLADKYNDLSQELVEEAERIGANPSDPVHNTLLTQIIVDRARSKLSAKPKSETPKVPSSGKVSSAATRNGHTNRLAELAARLDRLAAQGE